MMIRRFISRFAFAPRMQFCTKLTGAQVEILKDVYEKKLSMKDVKDESLIKEQDVFATHEQQLSFKLMSCGDINQLFQLYSDSVLESLESKIELTANELSLFIYFTGVLRGDDYQSQMEEHSDRFLQIMSRCLHNADKIDAQQFAALLWAISTYKIEMGSLRLNDLQQYIITEKVQMIAEKLSTDTLPALAFAVHNLLEDNQALILKIAQLVSLNITHVPPENLATLVSCLPVGSFTTARPIFDYLVESYEQDILTNEQFASIILKLIELTELNQFAQECIQLLSQKIDANKDLISLHKIVELLLRFSEVKGDFETITRRLIRQVHRQSENLDINSYINLWLTLPKIHHKISAAINLDKTILILTELLTKSKVFKLEDLSQSELVTIITACAALRLDNKTFISKIIESLEVPYLLKTDLVILAQSFVIYVRQFEREYIFIHEICAKRKLEFNSVEKAQLLSAFSRVRILIPDSPFFS